MWKRVRTDRLHDRVWKFFLLLCFGLNLWPIWHFSIFPTFDGPVFCSNLEILKSLLKDDAVTKSMYALNTYPVPNWLSQFLGAIFSWMFDTRIAEKLIQSLCITLLPLSFSFWLKTWKLSKYWVIALFPLAWNGVFSLGFYNFLLSISLLIFFLACWPLWLTARYRMIWIFMMCGALYFSHPTCMLLMVLFGHLYLFLKSPTKLFSSEQIKLGIAHLPWLLLFAGMIYNRKESGEATWIEASIIVSDFFKGKHMMFYSDNEMRYTAYLAAVPAALALIALVANGIATRVNIRLNTTITIASSLRDTDERRMHQTFALFFFLTVCLLFFFPNEDGWAGYVTMRLSLLIHIFIFMSLALLRISRIIMFATLTGLLLPHILLLTARLNDQKTLSDIASDIVSVAEQGGSGGTVITRNVSDNWFLTNAGSFASLASLRMVDNPSASTGYFPVCYKEEEFPFYLGNGEFFGCYVFPRNEAGKLPEHILVIGQFRADQACDSLLQNLTQIGYTCASPDDFVRLYSQRRD